MPPKAVNLVLDTNVFISAVFFSGVPYRILAAWRNEGVRLFVTRDILDEYRETAALLAKEFKGVDFASWLAMIESYATLVESRPLPGPVCEDPDDDMFIACALAAGVHIICSGDKALLKTTGYRGIEVLKPRAFVDRYLAEQ
jgi:uncharacterized protein